MPPPRLLHRAKFISTTLAFAYNYWGRYTHILVNISQISLPNTCDEEIQAKEVLIYRFKLNFVSNNISVLKQSALNENVITSSIVFFTEALLNY